MKLKYAFDKAIERPSFFLSQAARLHYSKALPYGVTEKQLAIFERSLTLRQQQRLDYYLKSADISKVHGSDLRYQVSDFKNTKNSLQYYDFAPMIHRFPKDTRFNIMFGDITNIPEYPSFVKSRPIVGNNANAVLLKIDSIRHFYFLKDSLSWEDKHASAIWRGHAHNPNRRALIQANIENPRVDAAQTNQNYEGIPPKQPFLTIPEQLKHKFIISIEGHDVATNLKWAMHSNSMVLTPKLVYETWFMEGTLNADEHFVEVNPDFSNINDKIDYYLTHPDKAKEIIRAANAYTEEFKDTRTEALLNLLVIQRYLCLLR